MSGLPSPQGSGAWRFHLLWLASAAIVLGVALVLLSPLSDSIHATASGVGLLLGGVALAGACWYQARRTTTPRRRRAWLLFGVAATVATIGNVTLLVVGTSMGPAAGLSLPDACLLLSLVLGTAAILTFPGTPRRPAVVARIVMDGVIVGGSLLFFASVTLFPQIVGPDGDVASRAVPLLLPVIDIVAATAAFLLYLRRNPSDGSFLGLVSIGFLFISVSDFSSAIATVDGPFSFGSVADIGWIAGFFVVALGVSTAPRTGFPDKGVREGSLVAGTALMLSVFLVAAVSVLIEINTGGLTTISAVLWLLIVCAVVVRQISLTFDNQVMRDILEDRVIEGSLDLQTATEQSELMLRSVADGIYGVDSAGMITLINPVAARLLGFEPAALIGRSAHTVFHAARLGDSPHSEDSCYITRAVRDGVVSTAEEDVYGTADGQLVPVEVTASQTRKDGVPVGAVVVFRDITQRREVDRLKDEFVSIVSHELRTPLTSIRGSLALLSGGALGPQTPQAHKMTTVALNSSIRLGKLINDILEVEQIHSGIMPMEIDHYSVRQLIEDSVAEIGVVASTAGIHLVLGSVEGTVVADKDRAQQALINLLDNAIKFSPPHATVTVSTEFIGRFTQFSIADEGRGIPPDKLETVFQRFEQVDSSDARDHGGTGLGLAISRSIVERLGGRIWAENNAGAGATIRFTLPNAASNEEAGPLPAAGAESPAPAAVTLSR